MSGGEVGSDPGPRLKLALARFCFAWKYHIKSVVCPVTSRGAMDGSEAWEARLASRRRWRGWLVGGAVRLVLVAACIDAAQASPRIHSRIHDDGGGSRALLNERGHLANAALLTHPDPCAGSVINAQPDACAYVRTHCAVEPGESLVDYRVRHHCAGPSRFASSVAVMCLVVALAFWILGDTAEGYFCPAVRTLADRWNLAPATAGVTLLALGNGAPDVFASLAAFSKFSANDGSSSDGGGDSTGGNITLNASETSSGMVGAIVSAGMFVSGAVVGAVALVASPFRVDPGPFNRDVGFYLVAVCGVFLVVMDGRVHPWEAVLLPAYYVVFVVYVVASDVSADPAGKTHSRHKRRRELTIGGEFDPGSRVNNNKAGPEENGSTRAQKDSGVELTTMEDGYAAESTGGEGSVDGIDESNKTDARRRNFASSAPLAVSARAVDALTSRATRWFALRWKEANGSESSNGGPGSGSLRRGLAAVWIVCFIAPLEAARRCTIPNASAKKYNAFYATCNVCLSPLLLLHLGRDVVIPLDRPVMYVPGSGSTGLTASVPVPAWGFTLLVSGSFAVLFWRRFHSFGGGAHNDWTPPPWWDGSATLVVSFLCSVAWIAVAATELLGCLTAIGGAIGVSPAALSVSVLAWGNSMGDLASDVVIARGGQPTMAVAACFSGPLFNMMVGLGSAFAMATAGLPVNQTSLPLARHPTIAMGFAFLFVSLVATATLVPRRGYVVTKTHGVGLIALYAVYMVCAVLVEIAYDGTGG